MREPLPTVLVPGLLCTARLYAEQIAALWGFGPVTVADHTPRRHDGGGRRENSRCGAAALRARGLVDGRLHRLCDLRAGAASG